MVMTYDLVCLGGELGCTCGLAWTWSLKLFLGFCIGHGFEFWSFGCYKHKSSGSLGDLENAT